jgi:hypothetical protein
LDFKLNNIYQILDGNVHVYPKEYFSVPSFDSKLGFARHHGTNLWKENSSQSKFKKAIRRLVGEPLYFKMVNTKICMKNEFSDIHRKHKQLK